MNTKKLIPIICMVSVFVMLVWGFIGSFEYSWLAVMAGGIIVAAISILDKKDSNK